MTAVKFFDTSESWVWRSNAGWMPLDMLWAERRGELAWSPGERGAASTQEPLWLADRKRRYLEGARVPDLGWPAEPVPTPI